MPCLPLSQVARDDARPAAVLATASEAGNEVESASASSTANLPAPSQVNNTRTELLHFNLHALVWLLSGLVFQCAVVLIACDELIAQAV